MTLVFDDETSTKEQHLKKLDKLSQKSIGKIPWLHDPNEEQQQWTEFRLLHPNTWPSVHENKIGDYKNWR